MTGFADDDRSRNNRNREYASTLIVSCRLQSSPSNYRFLFLASRTPRLRGLSLFRARNQLARREKRRVCSRARSPVIISVRPTPAISAGFLLSENRLRSRRVPAKIVTRRESYRFEMKCICHRGDSADTAGIIHRLIFSFTSAIG